MSRIGLLAPMPNELAPLTRALGLQDTGETLGRMPVLTASLGDTEVVATRTGIGPPLAYDATKRLLAAHPVDRIVVCGIAGGVPGITAVGDLVVPAQVVDSANGDRFTATPHGDVRLAGTIRMGDGSDYSLTDADLDQIRADGFCALDMETAAIARACAEHDVPWLAFRAISDMGGDASVDPAVMDMVDPDGRPKPWNALKYVLTHPHKIPTLARLGRDATRATRIAADAAVANLRGRR